MKKLQNNIGKKSTQIKTQRWRLIGHILRMKPDSLPRTCYANMSTRMEEKEGLSEKHGEEQLKERDVK